MEGGRCCAERSAWSISFLSVIVGARSSRENRNQSLHVDLTRRAALASSNDEFVEVLVGHFTHTLGGGKENFIIVFRRRFISSNLAPVNGTAGKCSSCLVFQRRHR